MRQLLTQLADLTLCLCLIGLYDGTNTGQIGLMNLPQKTERRAQGGATQWQAEHSLLTNSRRERVPALTFMYACARLHSGHATGLGYVGAEAGFASGSHDCKESQQLPWP